MKAISDFIDSIEQALLGSCKNMPAFSQGVQDFFVKIMPIVAILTAISYGITVISMVSFYMRLNDTYQYWGLSAVGYFSPMDWIGTALECLAVYAAVMAFSGLSKNLYEGWRWFFVAQITLALSMVFHGHLAGLIGIAIGLYILFQIRPRYTGEPKLTNK